jgi:hypothetical protein
MHILRSLQTIPKDAGKVWLELEVSASRQEPKLYLLRIFNVYLPQ